MFAVNAARPNLEDPLASFVIGERPEPEVPDDWVRVKIFTGKSTYSPCAGSPRSQTQLPIAAVNL